MCSHCQDPFHHLWEHLGAIGVLATNMKIIGELEDNPEMDGFGTLLLNTVNAMIQEMNAFESNRADFHWAMDRPVYPI